MIRIDNDALAVLIVNDVECITRKQEAVRRAEALGGVVAKVHTALDLDARRHRITERRTFHIVKICVRRLVHLWIVELMFLERVEFLRVRPARHCCNVLRQLQLADLMRECAFFCVRARRVGELRLEFWRGGADEPAVCARRAEKRVRCGGH